MIALRDAINSVEATKLRAIVTEMCGGAVEAANEFKERLMAKINSIFIYNEYESNAARKFQEKDDEDDDDDDDDEMDGYGDNSTQFLVQRYMSCAQCKQ